MQKPYRVCIRCIMDTTVSDINFDEYGICNYCRGYDERAKKELYLDERGQSKLKRIISKIKEAGQKNKYDCLIGLSGGMDSSMALYTIRGFGLRPLAVHVDNGWNSEISTHNIERLVKKLRVDLHTCVLDWEEFKDLQVSFLKASIANAEIPTDHALAGAIFRTAVKNKIPYIISGGNIVAEAIMPEVWMYDALDWKLIKSIHKAFGRCELKTFPHLTLFDRIYYYIIRGIKYFPVLNYIKYERKKAAELLKSEFGWEEYGSKHFESVYTRFFQAYILPKKFNIDKRIPHLSTLICSGQITREEALEEMKKAYYAKEKIEEDRVFVLSKLGLSEEEFNRIMSLPIKTFRDYPNNYSLLKNLRPLAASVRKFVTCN